MEMEDPNHHNHYNIDLRQFISARPTHFPPIPHPLPVDLFSPNRNHHQLPPETHHYDMMMLMPRGGPGLHEFHSDSTSVPACVPPPPPTVAAACVTAANSCSTTMAGGSATPAMSGLEGDGGSFGGDGGTGRWPRQETLTLLEIRSRLDSKFKEANQKGPLWDEVSRIMSEEHGYQRSGKKCREKFENLYKYYKKTKEGKAGRQDGKHYRFFRQLEALYGDTSNPCSIPDSQFVGNNLRFPTTITNSPQPNQENFHSHKLCDSLSLSNSSEFDTCSSEDNDLSTATLMENDSSEKRRKRRDGKSWKVKIKEFIDSQMRKLIERQETWLEKLTKTLEQKEQERMLREEEWRKQETARIDKEHRFWAKERAWMETRDAALMEALQKLTGRDFANATASSPRNRSENHEIESDHSWEESEITRLMQLRSSMESRFQQCGSIEEEEALWKEIDAKMGRNALSCKEKWDSINNYMRRKKRKENSRANCNYYQSNDSMYNPGGGSYCDMNEQGQETNTNQESCFPFLMGDGENLWENYGLKLSKGDHQNQ